MINLPESIRKISYRQLSIYLPEYRRFLYEEVDVFTSKKVDVYLPLWLFGFLY